MRNVLIWDVTIDSTKIDVSVDNGWVTLEGTVDALCNKFEAEDKAMGVRGVLGVTNKLAVVPTESYTDESIAEDLVKAIERNRNVNIDNVDVTVADGKVTLSGTVTTRAARQAAYNSALYTPGVTEIDDQITVVP